MTDNKLPMRAKLATSLSRGAAALSRATGRGDGSVIGGRIGLMVDPNLLAETQLWGGIGIAFHY